MTTKEYDIKNKTKQKQPGMARSRISDKRLFIIVLCYHSVFACLYFITKCYNLCYAGIFQIPELKTRHKSTHRDCIR